MPRSKAGAERKEGSKRDRGEEKTVEGRAKEMEQRAGTKSRSVCVRRMGVGQGS